MNDEEKIIEDNLKARFSHIKASRESFEQVLTQVTNEKDNRSIIVEGSLPSPYQSIYTIFVKKITLIGLPIIALALLLVYINFGTGQNESLPTPIFPQDEVAVENNQNDIPKENIVVADISDSTKVDSTSVDSLIDSIVSESDSDIAVAINDNEDDSIISEELVNYNAITTNNYENSI